MRGKQSKPHLPRLNLGESKMGLQISSAVSHFTNSLISSLSFLIACQYQIKFTFTSPGDTLRKRKQNEYLITLPVY